MKTRAEATGQRFVLTLNNAPEADQPLEQDFVTELVELFEKRNPDIRIQYSPWQYTPESFFERVKERTVTDIIEVDAEQMEPIMASNYAADITDNIAQSAEMNTMFNPAVFKVVSKDGRVFGMPTELHTLALFYNRKMLKEVQNRTGKTIASADEPKGYGAEQLSDEDFILSSDEQAAMEKAVVELAQYYGQQQPYGQPQSPYYSQQQLQQYYGQPQQPQQQPQQQPRRRRGGQQGQSQQQPAQPRQGGMSRDEYQQYYNDYYQQQQRYFQQHQRYFDPNNPPEGYGTRQQEDARARRIQSRRQDSETSQTRRLVTEDDTATATSTQPQDTLTTEAERAMARTGTQKSDAVTTVIKTAGLPTDWDQFIRLAVRMTDHKKEIYGFAPVLFSQEGGREFSQWAVLSGLEGQAMEDKEVKLDINSKQAGEVAQFVKDLRWRFDVMPPPSKCYYDNLMKMFAEGKLGMMIMPADGNTISQLLKAGMALDDIGVAALPAGPANRLHLTYGKCLVINSQIDPQKRAAAFRWLLFLASPEVQRLREQFYFREKEMTGAPRVPLYSHTMQQEYYESVKNYRSLPLYADYESVVASHLRLEPAVEKARFYEAVASGVFPIVDNENSDAYQAITSVAIDFEKKYLLAKKPDNIFQYYLQFIIPEK